MCPFHTFNSLMVQCVVWGASNRRHGVMGACDLGPKGRLPGGAATQPGPPHPPHLPCAMRPLHPHGSPITLFVWERGVSGRVRLSDVRACTRRGLQQREGRGWGGGGVSQAALGRSGGQQCAIMGVSTGLGVAGWSGQRACGASPQGSPMLQRPSGLLGCPARCLGPASDALLGAGHALSRARGGHRHHAAACGRLHDRMLDPDCCEC